MKRCVRLSGGSSHHATLHQNQNLNNLRRNKGSNGKKGNVQSHHLRTAERLKACLKDNSMTDVALVGDDGVYIPAIRCVLGTASPVLKQLLYTPSAESSLNSGGGILATYPQQDKVVSIPGFKQRTIKTLVEYCCSDDGDLSSTTLFGSYHAECTTPTSFAEAILDMLSFTYLTICYEIPNAPRQVVDEYIIPILKRYPSLSCLVFDYLLTVVVPRKRKVLGGPSSSHPFPFNPMTELSGNNDAGIAGSQAEQEAEANTVILAAAALSKLYTKSLHCIRTRPYQALAPLVLVDGSDVEEDKNMGICGICAFHPETLKKILADKEVEVDELFLLKMLQRWHNYHTQLLMEEEQKQKQKEPKSVHKITNIMQQMTSQTNTDAQEQKMLTEVQREKLSDNEFPLFRANFDEMTFASTAFGNSTITSAFSEVAPSWKPFSTAEDDAQEEVPYQFLPPHASTCAFSEQTSNKQQQEEQDTDGQYVCPNPSQVCRKLLPYIDLVAIDPVPLKKIVSQCTDFIDQSQVMDALWEQVTIASTLGPTRVCFSSIVRGTGDHRNGGQEQQGANSNSSIRGMLADLATDSMGNSGIPNHQYYKSHILVQGAGVEDCNGIYAQVVQPPRTRERIMNEHDGDQCDEGQKQETDDELTKSSLASGVSSPSYYTGDDRYDREEEESTTNMTANTAGINTTSAANASSGICLRFVKQNNQKRGKGKNKTCYLVCRREPMPVTIYIEKSRKISHEKNFSTSPKFLHCWTLIEEDNSWGKQEQLRVLYEWEMEGDLQDITSSSDRGKSSIVVDGSTLQPFPEQGWSSVKRKFSPAPTLTWCRPRHGTPVLVVPPPPATSKNSGGKKSGQKTGSTKKESAVSKRRSSGRMHANRQQTVQVTLPQTRFQDTMGVPFNHDDEALLDSLAGVQLSAAPTINFQLENVNKNDESDSMSPPPPPIRDVTIPTTTALERMWDKDTLEGIAAETQVEQMPAKKSFEGYEI